MREDAASTDVRQALRRLGVKNLTLGIHDPSFPGDPTFDLGRGTAGSAKAAAFLERMAGLGFNGVQLGPRGLTSRGNPSPYDGAAFSREPLNLDVRALVEEGLLPQATVDACVAQRPAGALERVDYAFTHHAHGALFDVLGRAHRFDAELRAFERENEAWLLSDAVYEALSLEHRTWDWRRWPTSDRAPGDVKQRFAALRAKSPVLDCYVLLQFLAERQQRALRQRLGRLGLKVLGDLQIGLSARDTWRAQSFLLDGYCMGAPPSRTNPEGQPWGYPVLDPAQLDDAGAALAFVRQRWTQMLADFDGVRIDHPHGYVCPWVYRDEGADPLAAVQGGARLYSSPDLPDHPRLQKYALVRPEQLNRALPRYADEWVASLSDEQVARYSRVFDEILRLVRSTGRDPGDLVCEVLSTLPHPLRRVLERHQLGRFRVLQKADVSNPADVYRSENAHPKDWVMLGNHDTQSIWSLAKAWEEKGELGRRADHFARLWPVAREREALAKKLQAERGLLVHAMLAEALASRAENVLVFFTDLFGFEAPYNVPGTVSDANWSLRVPSDFERVYAERCAQGRALDLTRAVDWALKLRGGDCP